MTSPTPPQTPACPALPALAVVTACWAAVALVVSAAYRAGLRDGDAFRFANRLEGWVEVKDGRIVDAGYGRELFGLMRRAAGPADAGACSLFEAA